MGGGGNSTWNKLTNPIAIILPKKVAWWADPVHNFTAQGVENWYNVLTNKEKFGQHKDWFGTGEKGLGNNTMRRWTEGKSFKKWETWKQEQAVEYEKQYAELRQQTEAKPKTKTPADTPLVRKSTPQKTTLLDDEVYPPTSYLT